MKIRIFTLSLLLLAASAFIARASKPEITPLRESLFAIPMELGNWRGIEAPELDSRVLGVLGVDDYINRTYYGPDNFAVGLYIGFYQSQRSGDTIHSPLNCLPGAGWNAVKNSHIPISVDGGSTIEINRVLVLKGMDEQLVLYWYQSHGRVIASEYWGKIYSVLDALRTNRTDAALIRIICPIAGMNGESEKIAEQRAVAFVKRLFPLLKRYLPE